MKRIVVDKLLEGVVEFKEDFFKKHKNVYKHLAHSQKPHTLYIGCSDSRVVPDVITNTEPGELFVLRNIANMIPPYNDHSYEFKCSASIIEYAVNLLEVQNIIVCGHSNCGGCKALYYEEEKLQSLPAVKQWLKLGENIKQRVLKKNLSLEEKYFQTEQLNIIQQLQNLFTYPYIKDKVISKKIKLYGWYYIIETGNVFNYNFDTKNFELIKHTI